MTATATRPPVNAEAPEIRLAGAGVGAAVPAVVVEGTWTQQLRASHTHAQQDTYIVGVAILVHRNDARAAISNALADGLDLDDTRADTLGVLGRATANLLVQALATLTLQQLPALEAKAQGLTSVALRKER
jgi:hypothetical protein